MAKHNEIGKEGEGEAKKYLEGLGYEIVDINVRYVYGEIDIVARESMRVGHKYHFVEVKTVARERTVNGYHPLQNISREKLNRLRRAVQAYIMGHKDVRNWQFDAVCVYLPPGKIAFCDFLENIVL
jgi:putative endonuclease